MRHLYHIISVFFLAITLSGCQGYSKALHAYHLPKSSQGLSCVKRCSASNVLCHKLCHADVRSCQARATKQARVEYHDYVARQKVLGLSLKRTPGAYYDPLQCSKASCNCAADYQSCYQMCGGLIVPQEKCQKNCVNG